MTPIFSRWIVYSEFGSSLTDCKDWLRQCRDDLHTSGKRVATGNLPSRLLEIGQEHIRLLVSTEGVTGRYWTLSWCWRDLAVFPRLRRNNIAEMVDGINIDRLPLLCQRTVRLKQCLGRRYVWIDALCIIQDDNEDWQREAEKLYDYYLNAECTLSVHNNPEKKCALSKLGKETCAPLLSRRQSIHLEGSDDVFIV